ncbi:hypothetical protein POM88_026931 [Heracleum sosnowskyi]|uniref:Uncharacterized protein n=1 Tax=Heracleum sosnowskyi TaxID=360622 RepID=A0AAD8I924_9APIA|nr:hypothetical protein POM88_026931 [Heracleum sosnowskyi]
MSNTYLDRDEAWVFEMIPNLEVLKLKLHAFVGENWETSLKAFPRLKFLKLDELNIAAWTASRIHFPVLEHLQLYRCPYLMEIPEDFDRSCKRATGNLLEVASEQVRIRPSIQIVIAYVGPDCLTRENFFDFPIDHLSDSDDDEDEVSQLNPAFLKPIFKDKSPEKSPEKGPAYRPCPQLKYMRPHTV